MMFDNLWRFCAAALLVSSAFCQSISQINGDRFLSPYRNETVSNVTGLVTATGPDGFWLRSTSPDKNRRSSESIFVFTSGRVNNTVGNILTLKGRVSEHRASSSYLYMTEITSPTGITIVSSNNTVQPVALGQRYTSPPTSKFTSLDGGSPFNLPNNQSLVSVANPVLEPTRYGLDFWESLVGELVSVHQPRAITKPNSFGDTWVVGNWTATSINSRAGLTLTSTDFNPEAILIGDSLDGRSNPDFTQLGDSLNDIIGVVYQAFGYYRILPLTALTITSSPSRALPPPASFTSTKACSGITLGQYNIENFAPNSTKIDQRARDIVTYLHSPDLIFLQEIQDNDGPTDDGVVESDITLSTLAAAISATGGPNYAFTYISPVNDQDGGKPGGNIRNAYLYNPTILALHNPNSGSSIDAVQVLPGPVLNFNPGLIAPADSAWTDSRKPLVAQWDILSPNSTAANTTSTYTRSSSNFTNSTFFTVNVHFTSKGGSSSIEGNARPPVNGGVDQRIAQANLTAAFAADILAEDGNAKVIVAGDFNEFEFVEPLELFKDESGLKNLDDVAKVPKVERYVASVLCNICIALLLPSVSAPAVMPSLRFRTARM